MERATRSRRSLVWVWLCSCTDHSFLTPAVFSSSLRSIQETLSASELELFEFTSSQRIRQHCSEAYVCCRNAWDKLRVPDYVPNLHQRIMLKLLVFTGKFHHSMHIARYCSVFLVENNVNNDYNNKNFSGLLLLSR